MSDVMIAGLIAATAALSLVISYLTNRIVRSAALNRGFVDHPGERKRHERPVPLGGGIGIVTAVALPVALIAAVNWLLLNHIDISLPQAIADHQPGLAAETWRGLALIAALVAMMCVGLFDDRRPLTASTKFLAQLLLALFAAWFCEIRLLTVLGPFLSIAVSTFWIILITNAFNLLDNMDGLSAGVAAIVAAILAWTALNAGQLFVPLMSVLLVGALIGFLLYNFPPATLYMGDAGSLAIGYLIAILTIRTTYYHPEQNTQPAAVLVPLVILAIPLYDVASVVYIRWRSGKEIFRADHRHFSHRLVQRGMTPPTAVLTIYLATAATALNAVFLPKADTTAAAVIIAQTFCILLIVALLERRPKNAKP